MVGNERSSRLLTSTAILPLQGVALAVFASAGFPGLANRGGGWSFSHEDDAALFAPFAQAQGGFQRLPAVAAILLGGSLAHHALHEVFDFFGVAEFEKVRKTSLP
jgi:hypothetical protein